MDGHLSDIILSLYTDGKCSADERAAAERHLSGCPSCREALDAITLMSGDLRSMSTVDLPFSYEAEFEKRLDGALKEARRRSPIGDLADAAISGLDALVGRLRAVRPVPAIATAVSLALLFVIIWFPVMQGLRPVSPMVILAQGAAEVMDPGTGAWHDVPAGLKLASGTVLRTGEGGRIDIGVNDKYMVRLLDEAELRMASLDGRRGEEKTTYMLADGLVVASTASGFEGSELIIRTEGARATVHGTRFLVDGRNSGHSVLAVIEGEVDLAGIGTDGLETASLAVKAGYESQILHGEAPASPSTIRGSYRTILNESYDMGAPGRTAPSLEAAMDIRYDGMVFVLIMPDTPDRAEWYLENGLLWTNDREPKPVNILLNEVEALRLQGIAEHDEEKHRMAVTRLEHILAEYPDYRYNPQLLLYTGAYYSLLLGDYARAIAVFDELVADYSETEIAGIAQYTIGLLYEERIRDYRKAEKAYRSVLTRYPENPEALGARRRLARLSSLQ